MDAGSEERFVSINVAQAADFLLVEKKIFDGLGTVQDLSELARSDLKRIRRQPRKARLYHSLIKIFTTPIDLKWPKAAETAGVNVD